MNSKSRRKFEIVTTFVFSFYILLSKNFDDTTSPIHYGKSVSERFPQYTKLGVRTGEAVWIGTVNTAHITTITPSTELRKDMLSVTQSQPNQAYPLPFMTREVRLSYEIFYGEKMLERAESALPLCLRHSTYSKGQIWV